MDSLSRFSIERLTSKSEPVQVDEHLDVGVNNHTISHDNITENLSAFDEFHTQKRVTSNASSKEETSMQNNFVDVNVSDRQFDRDRTWRKNNKRNSRFPPKYVQRHCASVAIPRILSWPPQTKVVGS